VKRFVLDASVTLAWFIDLSMAPLAARTQRFLLQGDRAIVPSLWHSEVANGFMIAQRRGTLSEIRIAQAFQELDILLAQSIENTGIDLSIQSVVSSAQQFGLTAYDATYLEIARAQQLPIATLDRKLSSAAKQAGVPLLS
jgi:predicted nucleic acid-binding protein